MDDHSRDDLFYMIGHQVSFEKFKVLIDTDLDFKTGELTIRETITMFQDPELMIIINLILKAEDG